MESIIVFLLIVAGSAFMNWLKNRGEGEDWSEQERPGGGGAPPPSRKKRDWEEELRRMLEEASGETSRPAPPPVIRRATPPPVPPPVPPVVRPVVQPAPRPIIYTHAPVEEPEGEETIVHSHLAPLTQSSTAYQRASQLQETVAQHMEDLGSHLVQPTFTTRTAIRTREMEEVISWFRHPRTMRQVLMASIILAPPKALQ